MTFRIGDAHISVANDITKQVSVFSNGKLRAPCRTSMGMGGSETIGGRTISFWTQPGIYTVMDQANPVVMDSSTYGLPINSRLGYKETINWATPHQHRRHIPPRTRRHRLGPGQHQRLPRLLEPQRRERAGSTSSPSPVTSSKSVTPAEPRWNCHRTATGACRGRSGWPAAQSDADAQSRLPGGGFGKPLRRISRLPEFGLPGPLRTQ